MTYTFIMLSLIIKELEAKEISTLKSLWCILNFFSLRSLIYNLILIGFHTHQTLCNRRKSHGLLM